MRNKENIKKITKKQLALLGGLTVVFVLFLVVLQGMVTGFRTKIISSSTNKYEDIILDKSTDLTGNHYPYVLKSEKDGKVYEPLVDKKETTGYIKKVKYIEENKTPYAIIETHGIKEYIQSSKNSLTNLGRKLEDSVSPAKKDIKYLKVVTVYQPVNYSKFVEMSKD